MCHKSPAKLLRSIKRITNFLEKKNYPANIPISRYQSSLTLFNLPPIDIPPLPPKVLSLKTLPPISIAPANPKKTQKLDISKCGATSTPPRLVYHPAVINASQTFFSKHPSCLTAEVKGLQAVYGTH